MSDVWTVKKDWDYSAVRFIRQTSQCVFYTEAGSSQERRGYKENFVDWQGDEVTAKLIAEKFTSAKSECRRRESAARHWLVDEQKKIIAKAKGGAS